MHSTYLNTGAVQAMSVCGSQTSMRLQYSVDLATHDLYIVKWKMIVNDQLRRKWS